MEASGFRTPVEPSPFPRLLDFSSSLVTLGSCFADSIGFKLQRCGFDVLANPAGAVYHPEAIHGFLLRAITGRSAGSESFLEHQGVWYSYDFHSSVHAGSSLQLASIIDGLHEQLTAAIQKADTLMITYGTAWVYRLTETAGLVANCHKQPGSLFRKELQDPDAIVGSFRQMFGVLRDINPNIQVVLTVSPVRHLADTIPSNQVSKSVLRLVCHRLASESNVHYFPAYEIMMDDLRDYRFYARDMIHPSDVALDYIWTCFQQAAFAPEIRSIITRWEKVLRSMAHRPFQPGSSAHLEFLKRLRDEVNGFSTYFNVQEQLNLLDAQITPRV